jgi:hypothetical protein
MIRVNLLKTLSKGKDMSKVAGFLKTFGLYILVAATALILWQGFFGANGAINLIKQQNEMTQKQLELIGQQVQMLNQQMSQTESKINELKEEQEAARQHIGTVAREEYHPAMKRVKEENAQEQLEEIRNYNNKLGLF